MKVAPLNGETSYILDEVAPSISSSGIQDLRSRFTASIRHRHRFCFHQSPAVDLHDIIICYDHATYIPPNKHIAKVESLIVLAGAIDFYFFTDSGKVYDRRHLSTPDSGHPFYLRVPPNTWHGLRAVGPGPCIIKETIAGPYDRSTLLWADFAPAESQGAAAGHAWYDEIHAQCEARGIIPPPPEVFERVSSNIFRSSRQAVTATLAQLQPIVAAARDSPLKRARLCCHNGPEEKLQEMFIALSNGVDIEESVHLRKDESLTVIHGTGQYLFPNEDGTTRKLTRLAPYRPTEDGEAAFFTRINRYVPHKINVDSDTLLIHEATTGPFHRDDTQFRITRPAP